jgi:hypothetical protein
MAENPDIAALAHVIQLAVAPVFLLTGIAGLLNVLNNRLSRIVDRARVLEAEFPAAAPGRVLILRVSLQRLAARARLVSWAITLCSFSAVLVSCVVIALFVGALAGSAVRIAIAGLFIVAMIALTLGLVLFLREIYLSTRYLRIGEPEPEQSPASALLQAGGDPQRSG